jgi:catechol-2,3-dioxygenase
VNGGRDAVAAPAVVDRPIVASHNADMSIPVSRLNHAVLFVRDAGVAAAFYQKVFGFEIVANERGGQAIFMRAASGDNHHDLGLFSVGPQAPRAPRGATGLYHLAWEVPTIDDLAAAARILSETGALGGASDHGVSKSLYGADPDGNEFEIMWRVPREAWGDYEEHGAIMPLDLEAEVKRWGGEGAARD